MKRFIAMCAMMIVIAPVSAQAKPKKPFIDLPSEVVEKAVKTFRPLVSQMKISETQVIGPETPEQLADPLLTEDEVEIVLVRGVISVTAEWCGLDWRKKSFEPFMKKQRAAGATPKQIAYIGALHDFGMGGMKQSYAGRTCEDQHKEKLAKYLY